MESRRTASHTNSPRSTTYTTRFHLIPYEPPSLRGTTEMVKPLGRLRPNRQRIKTWINITQTQAPNPCTGMGTCFLLFLFFCFFKENITIHFFFSPARLTSQVKAISRKKNRAPLNSQARTALSWISLGNLPNLSPEASFGHLRLELFSDHPSKTRCAI